MMLKLFFHKPLLPALGSLLLLCASPLTAANPNLGASGAQFLKIPSTARLAAMGDAGLATLDDASSVFRNPAGIAAVRGTDFYVSDMEYLNFFHLSSAAAVTQLGPSGSIAVALLVFSMDEMEMTTEFEPDGTGRFFDAQDAALSLSYARHLTDRFRLGLSAKLVHQRIWNESASGLAFDVGTQYRMDWKNLTLAMSMANFGPDMQFSGPDLIVNYDSQDAYPNRIVPTELKTEAFPLPLDFRFGAGLDLHSSPLLKWRANLDAVHPSDNDERIHLGSEITLAGRLILRTGWKFGHDSESLSTGAGLILHTGSLRLRFDYAYLLQELLPDVQLFSLAVGF